MNLINLRRSGRSAVFAAVATMLMFVWAAPGAAQTAIKFSLDGKLEGPAALVLLPLDKGYFRNEGLDVTVDEGDTALEPLARVANGGYDMGFADLNALIRYRDQNPAAPVKAIFMVYNKPPFAIVARKSRGISDPKSLETKKLGSPPASSSSSEWPLFAKLNDIDLSKVTVENVAIPVRVPMLHAGQLDAVLGYSFRVYVDLKDRGVPADDIVLMQMADYGLKLYGSALIVNSKFAADNPDAVRNFLRAYVKGLKEIARNPAAAVDTVVKREEDGKKAVELERLRMALRDNILTPEAKANGFGAIDPVRLEAAIAQLGLTYTFKVKPKVEDVFDASFLPSTAERRIN